LKFPHNTHNEVLWSLGIVDHICFYLFVFLFSYQITQSGLTALLWAADMGHIEVVELLLADGADLHAVDEVRFL